MTKTSLAFLSSPALLAAFLLSCYPAQANTNKILVNQDADLFLDSVVIKRETPLTNPTNQDSEERYNLLTSDFIGDLAINKLGCDCMGCRRTVANSDAAFILK